MRNHCGLAVLGGAVLGLVLVTGCSSTATRTADPPATEATTPTPATTPAPASPSASLSATPASTPLCGTPDLQASVREAPGGGAAGSVTSDLRLTNAGDHACTLTGWAGVSYVGDGDGTQIGAAARRTAGAQQRTVTLAPGASAVEQLTERDPGAYGDRCRPTPADGLRVYPPDNRESLFVRRPSTACSDRAVGLLAVEPFHAAT